MASPLFPEAFVHGIIQGARREYRPCGKSPKVKVLQGYGLRKNWPLTMGCLELCVLSQLGCKGVFALWLRPSCWFLSSVRIDSFGKLAGVIKLISAGLLVFESNGQDSRREVFPACSARPPGPESPVFFVSSSKIFFDDHNPPHFHAEYKWQHCVDRHWESFCFLWSPYAPRVDGTGNRVGDNPSTRTLRQLGQGTGSEGAAENRSPRIGFASRVGLEHPL